MTIRLRAHHLLCLLTYVGKGYSPDFTANYDVIARRLSQGEDIVTVAGPDDICAPLLNADCHCREPRIDERDRLAAHDVGRLLHLSIQAGTHIDLTAPILSGLRNAFAADVTRRACAGCEWSSLCSTVSAGGYEKTRVWRAP